MKTRIVTFILFGVFALAGTNVFAVTPPGILNHQGRIAVSGVNYNGTGYFKFVLVDAAGTTSYWSNDGTSAGGGEPTNAVAVTVTSGHYAVGLGDASLTNMTTVPASVFTGNADVRLAVYFGTAMGGPFEALTPNRRITSGGYALSAGEAQGVAVMGITSAMLADGAVTGVKLAEGAVSGLDSPDGVWADLVFAGDSGRVGVGAAELIPDFLQSREIYSAGLTSGTDVVIRGQFAYVLDSSAGLAIFDISDPSNLVAMDNDSAGSGSAIALQGNYAYVVDLPNSELSIFDISSPDAIVAMDTDGTGLSSPISVAVQGDFAYVVDRASVVLAIFDISDPATIVPRDTDSTGLNSPNAVAVQGDYAYVVGAGMGLAIFDISDETSIVARDTDTTGLNNTRDVEVIGDYAYVVDWSTNVLAIFDVSDPFLIVARDTDGTDLNNPRALAVFGDLAYVVSTPLDNLIAFDVSNPSNIGHVVTTPSGLVNLRGVAADGGVVYLTGSGGGLEAWETIAQLTVGGSLRVTGPLLDGSADNGGSGQILSTTGASTDWIDLLDNDPANELQTLGLATNTLSISGGNDVSLASYLDNTDNQLLTLVANTLSIENGNAVDMVAFLDNTDGQTLALATNTLSISGGNGVSLAGYLDNTDNQLLTFVGTDLLIGGGNAVNLVSLLDNTDGQTLGLAGDTLSIIGGNAVNMGQYFEGDGSETFGGNFLPNGNDTRDLGATGSRWRDLYLGPGSVHLGATGDEVVLSYNTTSNDLEISSGDLVLDNNASYAAKDSGGTVRLMLTKTASDETQLATATGEDIIFKDGSTVNMTIKGDGRVGVGVGTPTNGLLELRQQADTSADGLTVVDSSDTRAVRLWVDSSSVSRLDSGVSGTQDLVLNGGGGNVGVGTTSPDNGLHVVDSGFPVITAERTSTSPSGAAASQRFLSKTSANMADGFGSFVVFSIEDDAAVSNNIAQIGAMRAGADDTGDLIFRTYASGVSSDRMRLASDGDLVVDGTTLTVDASTDRVGMGTAFPVNPLHVSASEAFPVVRIENTNTTTNADGLRIQIGPTANPANGNDFIQFRDGNGSDVGSIDGDGSGGTRYNTTSDARLKQDIEDMRGALWRLEALRPREYAFRSRPELRREGFIAQEVAEVYPQAVGGDPDGDVETEPMMIDYSQFTPLLAGGVKELHGLVEAQAEALKALEKENVKLRVRLERLEKAMGGLQDEN